MPKYIVDANILIQAYRKYYPMDVFLGFWDKVRQLAHRDEIISIDKVRNEILPSGDELSQWCIQQLPNDFFIQTDSVIGHYANVIRKVSELNRYTPNAISEFARDTVADAFLVATALSSKTDYVLVSEETFDPRCIKRVKIPDVCSLFNVRCINTVEMFRELCVQI